MKPKNQLKKETPSEVTKGNSDNTSADNDADKSGTDTNSDKTEISIPGKLKSADKFDKPKRETDPDKTGIDTKSDKTKPEKSSK